MQSLMNRFSHLCPTTLWLFDGSLLQMVVTKPLPRFRSCGYALYE